MAHDEQRSGNIFRGETDVETEGAPLLLSAAEAARWKPDERHWTDYMGVAPGQGGNRSNGVME